MACAARVCDGRHLRDYPPVPIYTIGAFVGPLEDSFGWSRGAILSATSVAYLALIFSGPLAGFLTDRYGPRQVALWCVAGMSLAVGSTAFLASSLLGFYLAYALIGLIGGGTSPVVWTRAVSSWFVKKRGFGVRTDLDGNRAVRDIRPHLRDGPRSAHSNGAAVIWLLAIVPLVVVLPLAYFWFFERQRAPTSAESPGSGVRRRHRAWCCGPHASFLDHRRGVPPILHQYLWFYRRATYPC